jgi:hypothetical protein
VVVGLRPARREDDLVRLAPEHIRDLRTREVDGVLTRPREGVPAGGVAEA